jgi:hypothetical protein
MATVPGDPDNVTPMMPKWAQPTTADFLQAAAIMHQKGRLQPMKFKMPKGGVLEGPPKGSQEIEGLY